jgi:hypothetical protein
MNCDLSSKSMITEIIIYEKPIGIIFAVVVSLG